VVTAVNDRKNGYTLFAMYWRGIPTDEGTKLKRQQRLTWVALAVGVGLFVLLVVRTDPTTIGERVWQVGAGFLILILISGLRHFLRTLAWYYAIDREERRLNLWDLFGIRMAGEAVSDLTVLGPLLGETVKGITLSRRVSASHSASSLLIENLAYAFGISLLIASGLVLFVVEFAIPSSFQQAGSVVLLALILAGSAIALAVKKRYKLASKILDQVTKLRFRWCEGIEASREQVHRFEEIFYGFYSRHKGDSGLILALEILAGLVGVGETYAILVLTVHRATFLTAFIIEAVYRAVVLFFAFVPLRLGVDEGEAALVLKVLGYGAVEGVSMAIIRKIRTLFWVAFGLLMAARHSVPIKGLKVNDPSHVPASK
jgi:glycosyltransferase 2 family protein